MYKLLSENNGTPTGKLLGIKSIDLTKMSGK